MNYDGLIIPEDTAFTVGDSEVWLTTIDAKSDRAWLSINSGGLDHWMSYREGFQNIDIVDGQLQRLPITRTDVPIKWHSHNKPLVSVVLVRKSLSQSSPIPKPTLRYSDYGSAVIKGNEPWHIDLDAGQFLAARLVVQIQDALVCDEGKGDFKLYTSADRDQWKPVDKGGFPDGPFTIEQKVAKSGRITGDDLFLIGLSKYVRVSYEPRDIRGWGFTARVTIDAKQRRS